MERNLIKRPTKIQIYDKERLEELVEIILMGIKRLSAARCTKLTDNNQIIKEGERYGN